MHVTSAIRHSVKAASDSTDAGKLSASAEHDVCRVTRQSKAIIAAAADMVEQHTM
jgi:hypothetical protein